jgi:predicted lipoprotein
MTMAKRIFSIMLAAAMCALISSCKIVKIDPEAEQASEKTISSGEKAVDVASYMAEHWDADILPEINERRVSLGEIMQAAGGGWDQAGEALGVIKGDIGSKYNFIVQDTAVVKEINTESKAGYIVVEIEGVPAPAIHIATGPVLKGTAIRDSLNCVDFNQFVNQMDYAKLANELNKIGNDNITQSTSIEELAGKTIEFTGSFTQPEDGAEILIMPVFMEVK